MSQFMAKGSKENLVGLSISVTNGWDDEKEQPRDGLVYLSDSSFGDRGVVDLQGEIIHYYDRPKPVHVVSHDFGAWLGYEPKPEHGFVWESCSGSELIVIPLGDGLWEFRCSPSGDRGTCFYMDVLKGLEWSPVA